MGGGILHARLFRCADYLPDEMSRVIGALPETKGSTVCMLRTVYTKMP